MNSVKYLAVHPQSAMGLLFFDGPGDPDWVLVAVAPNGLYLLRRRNWLERLFKL